MRKKVTKDINNILYKNKYYYSEIKNRCVLTYRAKSVYAHFRVSRVELRRTALSLNNFFSKQK